MRDGAGAEELMPACTGDELSHLPLPSSPLHSLLDQSVLIQRERWTELAYVFTLKSLNMYVYQLSFLSYFREK